MSMTELERYLLEYLERLQQEYRLSLENQDKRLASMEIRQEEQEQNLIQLTELFNTLESLLKTLKNLLQRT